MYKFYCPEKIENNVQQHWQKNKTFEVIEDNNKKKFYCLSMLPYPSGALHIGHVRNYTIGDIIARYQRMLGKNVLHPIGWDAFGLPAERAAIIHNTIPAIWTYKNIHYMRQQLKNLGFSFDWSREIITCKPEYYRWEQWLFIKLYEKGLIYRKTSKVNWCPQDNTVLANEQVINGCCWRCHTHVTHKNIPQWFIKITSYADQLLSDLDKLKYWPKKIKNMQKNWIGRSEGFEIIFKITNYNKTLKIYITNIKKLIYITYITISINHKLSYKLSKDNMKILEFIQEYHNIKLTTKDVINIEKKGINTNIFAIHPITHQKLPIWIINYFPMHNYDNINICTPSLDKDDFNFAKKYNLPLDINENIKKIFKNKNILNQKQNNICSRLNLSQKLNNIVTHLINQKIAKYKIRYRLHDWGISRQRYWGAPIPTIMINNKNIIPISINNLPVILPEKFDIKYGLNPLKYDKKWKNIIYNGYLATRDTDTFDTFVESSWYYARYTCPNYNEGMLDSKSANYWLPIDQYIGGIEHAIMHLMYFRFYHKLMRDLGLVNSDEPAIKLLCQGMVLANAFYYLSKNNKQIWVNQKNVNIKYDKNGEIIEAHDKQGRKLIYAGMIKMSKSKNNGVDPQLMIQKYGADTIRLFIMFAAPPELPLEWKETGIQGAKRFLDRLWNVVYNHIQKGPVSSLKIKKLNETQKKLRKLIYDTIIKVTKDIEKKQTFNTAIAAIMNIVNKIIDAPKETEQDRSLIQESLEITIRLIYPFTPHISFVLWKYLGNKNDIDKVLWPDIDKKAIIEKNKNIIIQINGKFRCIIVVPINSDQQFVHEQAIHQFSIKKKIKNNQNYNLVFIKNKLLNFVLI